MHVWRRGPALIQLENLHLTGTPLHAVNTWHHISTLRAKSTKTQDTDTHVLTRRRPRHVGSTWAEPRPPHTHVPHPQITVHARTATWQPRSFAAAIITAMHNNTSISSPPHPAVACRWRGTCAGITHGCMHTATPHTLCCPHSCTSR